MDVALRLELWIGLNIGMIDAALIRKYFLETSRSITLNLSSGLLALLNTMTYLAGYLFYIKRDVVDRMMSYRTECTEPTEKLLQEKLNATILTCNEFICCLLNKHAADMVCTLLCWFAYHTAIKCCVSGCNTAHVFRKAWLLILECIG